MDDNKILSHTMCRTLDALIEWLAHTIVVAGLLIGFRLTEYLLHVLYNGGNRLLFGVLPLHWIFDAADLGTLVGFLTCGVLGVLRAFSGNRPEAKNKL